MPFDMLQLPASQPTSWVCHEQFEDCEVQKLIVAEMPKPRVSSHRVRQAMLISKWLWERCIPAAQIRVITELLDDEVFIKADRGFGGGQFIHGPPYTPNVKSLLWRRHLLQILSWDTRLAEGHPFGIPSDNNFKTRNTLWPNGSTSFDVDSNMFEGDYVCCNEEHPLHIQEPVDGLRICRDSPSTVMYLHYILAVQYNIDDSFARSLNHTKSFTIE